MRTHCVGCFTIRVKDLISCDRSIMAGISEGLGHLTLVQIVVGSKPPSDLSKSVRGVLVFTL